MTWVNRNAYRSTDKWKALASLVQCTEHRHNSDYKKKTNLQKWRQAAKHNNCPSIIAMSMEKSSSKRYLKRHWTCDMIMVKIAFASQIMPAALEQRTQRQSNPMQSVTEHEASVCNDSIFGPIYEQQKTIHPTGGDKLFVENILNLICTEPT